MKRLLTGLLLLGSLIGCSQADISSRNLRIASEEFELTRRIIFYNGITGDYMLSIRGRCSVETDRESARLEVTCKLGPSIYKKHMLGLSDNVSYFVEQLEGSEVSGSNYKVIFRPSVIVPDIELK